MILKCAESAKSVSADVYMRQNIQALISRHAESSASYQSLFIYSSISRVLPDNVTFICLTTFQEEQRQGEYNLEGEKAVLEGEFSYLEWLDGEEEKLVLFILVQFTYFCL